MHVQHIAYLNAWKIITCIYLDRLWVIRNKLSIHALDGLGSTGCFIKLDVTDALALLGHPVLDHPDIFNRATGSKGLTHFLLFVVLATDDEDSREGRIVVVYTTRLLLLLVVSHCCGHLVCFTRSSGSSSVTVVDRVGSSVGSLCNHVQQKGLYHQTCLYQGISVHALCSQMTLLVNNQQAHQFSAIQNAN